MEEFQPQPPPIRDPQIHDFIHVLFFFILLYGLLSSHILPKQFLPSNLNFSPSTKNVAVPTPTVYNQPYTKIICTNKTPAASNDPGLQQALYKVKQQYDLAGVHYPFMDFMNCIHLQYKDLTKYDALGLTSYTYYPYVPAPYQFYVDVDPPFKALDPLATEILLSHELMHVNQAIRNAEFGQTMQCMNKEMEAVYESYYFSTLLRGDDLTQLKEKIGQIRSYNNTDRTEQDIYSELYVLQGMSGEAYDDCHPYSYACYKTTMLKLMTDDIGKNYENECGSTRVKKS